MVYLTTITDSLRYAEDYTNAVDCLLSQDQKKIFLTIVSNDQLNFDSTSNARIITSQRITIADGYRAWTANEDTPFDGYLYPRIEQLKTDILIQSNNQFAKQTFLIGSIVFPYNMNGIVGGLAPLETFQPRIGANNNTALYLQIFGLGLPDDANFFTIKEIRLSGKGVQEGISYKLVAEANGLTIS